MKACYYNSLRKGWKASFHVPASNSVGDPAPVFDRVGERSSLWRVCGEWCVIIVRVSQTWLSPTSVAMEALCSVELVLVVAIAIVVVLAEYCSHWWVMQGEYFEEFDWLQQFGSVWVCQIRCLCTAWELKVVLHDCLVRYAWHRSSFRVLVCQEPYK